MLLGVCATSRPVLVDGACEGWVGVQRSQPGPPCVAYLWLLMWSGGSRASARMSRTWGGCEGMPCTWLSSTINVSTTSRMVRAASHCTSHAGRRADQAGDLNCSGMSASSSRSVLAVCCASATLARGPPDACWAGDRTSVRALPLVAVEEQSACVCACVVCNVGCLVRTLAEHLDMAPVRTGGVLRGM